MDIPAQVYSSVQVLFLEIIGVVNTVVVGKKMIRMRVLVVAGHPDSQSLSAHLARSYTEAARQSGHEVALIDLASAQFDPVLRFGYRKHMVEEECIKRSQELLQWCEHVTVVFPVWWGAEPSVLKGWFDRVLTPGKAYRYIPGKLASTRLLRGRSATLIATSHAPALYTTWNPAYPLSRIAKHVLGYCGIKVTKRLVFGGIDGKNAVQTNIDRFITRVEQAARDL